jgi:putative endonuclease
MARASMYILASGPHGILFEGVTNDLAERMAEHAGGVFRGFPKKYGVGILVYYETHLIMDIAIDRQKTIHNWRRDRKIRLIESMNPKWTNLYDPLTGAIAFGSGDREATEEPDPT